MVLWGCGGGGEEGRGARGDRRGRKDWKRGGECAGMGSMTWAMRNGSEGEFEIKSREEECEEGRGEMCEEKEGAKPRQRFQSQTYHSDGLAVQHGNSALAIKARAPFRYPPGGGGRRHVRAKE